MRSADGRKSTVSCGRLINQSRVTWSRKLSTSMWSMRSRCEWKESTTVSGTFSRYSTMKPNVTSSGNLILSPMVTNLPLLAKGIIFIANARLIQNPAPPVANQNLIFSFSWLSLDCFLFSKLFIACGRERKKFSLLLTAAICFLHVSLASSFHPAPIPTHTAWSGRSKRRSETQQRTNKD